MCLRAPTTVVDDVRGSCLSVHSDQALIGEWRMTNELPAAESDTVEVWAETVRVRILQESAAPPDCDSEVPTGGFDPYNTGIRALTTAPEPRKRLDDMRRLSEAIKRNRGG